LPPPHPLHASQPLYFPFVKLLTVSYPRPPASLYITHAYQNLSLGSLCLTILENLAIEEFKAEWLTLDTTPYVIDDMSKENSNAKESEGEAETEKEGKENGSGKEPGKERIGEESRNLGWYRRRGYEEFRVSLIRGFRFGRDGGWAMAVRMVMVFRRRWLGLAWCGVVSD
jgi:hypothetical protein